MPYSDLCREKILSEDYRDFIVSDIRMPFLQDMLEKDYCLQNPGFFYQCAYLSKSVIKPVSLENYSYFSIPKCYSLLSMQALNQAGILPIQNHSTLQLSGKQVMIGFLDTGIDYQNPVFQHLDKTSRIAGIWDQTIQSGTPPESLTMALIIHAT